MKWAIENGIIKWRDGENIVYPDAKAIFKNTDNDIGLSFAKMFALKCEVSFLYQEEKIYVSINAKKSNKLYKLIFKNQKICDYLLIDNTCYYLDSIIDIINDYISSEKLDISRPINFFDYINLAKKLSESNISYSDKVSEQVNLIKTNEDAFEHKGFEGKLFPYQESGVRWLNFMSSGKCGCILADSMGLGKTLQIILTLGYQKEKNDDFISLIISPLSILENWKREINKFYPSLKCHVNYGNTNLTFYKEFLEYDVIITSYTSVLTNFSTYEMINWDIVVLDEAQNIKNPYAKRTKTIKDLSKNVGIAVSGTPFENHITDIWSITDFVLPGYLGSLNEFKTNYDDDINSAQKIETLISPIMIRRKVEDVAKDLPSRVDIPQALTMSMDEAKYYDAELKSFDELKIMKLDKIQKLRMFCTHPSVYDDSYLGIDPTTISQKYKRCCEILEEIVSNNEKAIIFTSFNEMINLLVKDIHNRFDIPTDFINGSIEAKNRQAIIDGFGAIRGSAVMVLNPRTAGAGLNITAANHVIHYNLEWNPAIEDQASARSYRRGQEKTVFIHRLFYLNTIEEVINEKIERKRNLSDAAIIGNDGEINSQDLARALTLSPLNRRNSNEV